MVPPLWPPARSLAELTISLCVCRRWYWLSAKETYDLPSGGMSVAVCHVDGPAGRDFATVAVAATSALALAKCDGHTPPSPPPAPPRPPPRPPPPVSPCVCAAEWEFEGVQHEYCSGPVRAQPSPITCPGQSTNNYCDCGPDCVYNPAFCDCEEANACCAGKETLADYGKWRSFSEPWCFHEKTGTTPDEAECRYEYNHPSPTPNPWLIWTPPPPAVVAIR